jgi:pimeloyl-ACP methyl ester carboxylesterase
MASDRGYVLMHGACLGGWLWDRLVPRLDAPALALDLPGRGDNPADPATLTLAAAVDDVTARCADWGPARLTLVGHSMGAVFALAVGARLAERVEQLAFISAAIPRPGRSMLSVMPTSQRLLLPLLVRFRPQSLKPPPGAMKKALCNDLDDETTAWVQERVIAEVPAYYRDPLPWGSLPRELPRRYVKTLQDKSGFTTKRQDRMIANLGGADVREIDAGHLPMLSQPEQLGSLLNAGG